MREHGGEDTGLLIDLDDIILQTSFGEDSSLVKVAHPGCHDERCGRQINHNHTIIYMYIVYISVQHVSDNHVCSCIALLLIIM